MTHIPDAAVQAFIERYELGCNHRYDENSICAALPYLQPVAVAAVTRPVTNIESRTPKEVFDIMCDRIRALSAEPDLKGQQHDK